MGRVEALPDLVCGSSGALAYLLVHARLRARCLAAHASGFGQLRLVLGRNNRECPVPGGGPGRRLIGISKDEVLRTYTGPNLKGPAAGPRLGPESEVGMKAHISADILEARAAEQRNQLRGTVLEFRRTVKERLDLKRNLRDHVWPISGVAALVGLALGLLVAAML